MRVFAEPQFHPSGQWSNDDYDLFDGEQHIGRNARGSIAAFNLRFGDRS